jgi:hypothetical protein
MGFVGALLCCLTRVNFQSPPKQQKDRDPYCVLFGRESRNAVLAGICAYEQFCVHTRTHRTIEDV